MLFVDDICIAILEWEEVEEVEEMEENNATDVDLFNCVANGKGNDLACFVNKQKAETCNNVRAVCRQGLRNVTKANMKMKQINIPSRVDFGTDIFQRLGLVSSILVVTVSMHFINPKCKTCSHMYGT